MEGGDLTGCHDSSGRRGNDMQREAARGIDRYLMGETALPAN